MDILDLIRTAITDMDVIAEFLNGYAFGVSAVRPNLYSWACMLCDPRVRVPAVHACSQMIQLTGWYVRQKCLWITVPDPKLVPGGRMTTKLQRDIGGVPVPLTVRGPPAYASGKIWWYSTAPIMYGTSQVHTWFRRAHVQFRPSRIIP